MRTSFAVLVVAGLFLVSLVVGLLINYAPKILNKAEKPFYFGVSFGGETVKEAKTLIDQVKNFTNLFVLQSGSLQEFPDKIDAVCDYAVSSGLCVVVYFNDLNQSNLVSWLTTNENRWDEQFLGLYYCDEPIGRKLDSSAIASLREHYFEKYPDLTCDSYAKSVVDGQRMELEIFGTEHVTLITSDYVLYWFTYKGGYDIVLAQLGWNNTIAQEIALVRGAANVQNKSWGSIITWTYNHSPYLASGDEIYEHMRQSYECGAEYVVVFNYAEDMNGTYGILQDEHLEAMELFWGDVVQNPDVVCGGVDAEAVLVLPKNYGWGMRAPTDSLWGLWDADEKSEQIWNIKNELLNEYGLALDIVYDDPEFPVENRYSNLFYWNQTSLHD